MTAFADVEATGFPAPPRGVRMALWPGDVAGVLLLEPPRMDGWGEGYIRTEALVTGVLGPGRYEGEMPDGSVVRFSQRNVADVAPGPELGGIFDWATRRWRPAPPSPPPPGAIVPAPPTPPPGLLAPLKKWFVELFRPAPPGAPPPDPGLFAGVFAPPAAPPPPRGIVRVTEEVFAPAVPPPAPPPVRVVEAAAAVFAPPVEPGPLATLVPQVVDVAFPKAPEKAPEEAKQLTLWEAMFPAEPPKPTAFQEAVLEKKLEKITPLEEAFAGTEPEVPLEEIFTPYAKEQVAAPQRAREGIPHGTRRAKVLPLPPRAAVLPLPEEIARGFVTRYHPIEDLWETIRGVRVDPGFQAEAAKPTGASYTFETLGVCNGHPDVFEELSSFFHVPWEEIRKRARIAYGTDERGEEYEQWTNLDDVFFEIVAPLGEIVHQALEYIRPRDLPGAFVLEWIGTHEHRCQLGLKYVEGGGPVPPADVRPPAETQFTEAEYERRLEEERARMLREAAEEIAAAEREAAERRAAEPRKKKRKKPPPRR